MRLVYLTAGAAGMYCGSCMHDNALAKALRAEGLDVVLAPLYTPIRTDEDDVSIDRVFFGGLNVYLQQRFSLFRYLPSFLDRFFDQPWLIRLATSRGSEMRPEELGALTVSMLKGHSGHQRKEVAKLCRYLATSLKPDVVLLTNMLVAGCVPALKKQLDIPVIATLQGDDIFLDELIDPYREQAFAELRRLAQHVDGFLVNSQYYADHMAAYWDLDPARMHQVPLGLDTADFAEFLETDEQRPARSPTIGYLARLAPEKGLHLLVEAFVRLHQQGSLPDARLLIAGWLGKHNKGYAENAFQQLRDAGLEDRFEYRGVVDRPGKLQFLREIDVLSVPTVYREPKGLYVLEALAAGVPVIQPAHGAFPEMLSRLEGGRLFPPGDVEGLASELHRLLDDSALRTRLGQAGRQAVHQRYNASAMAQMTAEVVRKIHGSRGSA